MTQSDANDGSAARSTYQVRVRDLDTGERVGDEIRTVRRELPFLGPLSPHSVKVSIEIINVRTGAVVATMNEEPHTARGVVELIGTDLDRLDAAAFASEWGINPRA